MRALLHGASQGGLCCTELRNEDFAPRSCSVHKTLAETCATDAWNAVPLVPLREVWWEPITDGFRVVPEGSVVPLQHSIAHPHPPGGPGEQTGP
jgi:hypothetical protein